MLGRGAEVTEQILGAAIAVHEAQILTYLKLSGLPLGLLLNFNVPMMREGIRRFVLDPPP